MTDTRELVELLLAYDARTATGRLTHRAADLITALAEENRRLREALEPFAAIADLFDSEVEGHADTDELSLFYGDGANWLADRFTFAQFNAARAALSSTGEKGVMAWKSEFLPCPLCGQPVFVNCDDYSPASSGRFYTECQTVDCIMPNCEHDSYEALRDGWNRRTGQGGGDE
ncbi:hypothetical protein [Paracoccus versutus]|uniref:Uncharacterized protein n=1 Tax=Paracoccus versutus TaxID=34007 RepID=A0A3D9XPK0_PARVE|nr:hypothetical protein [Paracoccus versutus]REF72345.1 hypothetical protein BDD41_0815 [Paracoccus versutus]WGR55676.1 hypothetical protein E3U25_06770 [Paracoccus versutus]